MLIESPFDSHQRRMQSFTDEKVPPMSTPEDQMPDDAVRPETTDDLDLIEEESLNEGIEPEDIDDSP